MTNTNQLALAAAKVEAAKAVVQQARDALSLALREAATAAADERRLADLRRSDAKRAEANAIAKARRKAKALAALHGVEIERHMDLDSKPLYVSHPALEGPLDPHEGDHYVHDWRDVLIRVRDYAEAISLPADPLAGEA